MARDAVKSWTPHEKTKEIKILKLTLFTADKSYHLFLHFLSSFKRPVELSREISNKENVAFTYLS